MCFLVLRLCLMDVGKDIIIHNYSMICLSIIYHRIGFRTVDLSRLFAYYFKFSAAIQQRCSSSFAFPSLLYKCDDAIAAEEVVTVNTVGRI